MTETFRWRVASDNKAVHKFDVRSVRFGDGYEQRQPKSLKPKLRSWEIKIVGQKALMAEIKAFFDARRGVEPFNWRPPDGVPVLVKVSEYQETAKGGKAYELSCTFAEVFS